MSTIQDSIGKFVSLGTSGANLRAFIMAVDPEVAGIVYTLGDPNSVALASITVITDTIVDHEADERFLFGHIGNAKRVASLISDIQQGKISKECYFLLSEIVCDFLPEVSQIFLEFIIQPLRAVLYIADGDRFLKESLDEEAIICYGRAEENIECLPKGFFHLYYNMGNAYYECENFKKAIECYNQAVEVESVSERDKADVYSNLGNAHYRLGEHYELEALKMLGDKSKYEDALGSAKIGIEEYKLARDCYSESKKVKTDLDINRKADATINEANTYLALGRAHDLAIAICEQGEDFYERVGQTEAAERLLEVEINIKGSMSAVVLYNQARDMYQELLSGVYSNLVRTDAQNNLGCVYFQLEDYRNAMDSYLKAEELFHKNTRQDRAGRTTYARIQYNLALVSSRIDGPLSKGAKTHFTKAMDADDLSYAPKYYLHMISSYTDVHDTGEVLEYISNMLDISQKKSLAKHHFKLKAGDLHRHARDFDKARGSYGAILDVDRDNAEALEKIGNTFYLEGAYREAIKFYDKARVTDHHKLIPWLCLAECYTFLDEPQKAIELCIRAKAIPGMITDTFWFLESDNTAVERYITKVINQKVWDSLSCEGRRCVRHIIQEDFILPLLDRGKHRLDPREESKKYIALAEIEFDRKITGRWRKYVGPGPKVMNFGGKVKTVDIKQYTLEVPTIAALLNMNMGIPVSTRNSFSDFIHNDNVTKSYKILILDDLADEFKDINDLRDVSEHHPRIFTDMEKLRELVIFGTDSVVGRLCRIK